MNYNNYIRNLQGKFGIQQIYQMHVGQFNCDTVLAVRNNKNITVSQVQEVINFLIEFIIQHFDINNSKYKQTLKLLKSMRLLFNNKKQEKPKKKVLKHAIDVFKEIENLYSHNEYEKNRNEEIASILKFIIEICH